MDPRPPAGPHQPRSPGGPTRLVLALRESRPGPGGAARAHPPMGIARGPEPARAHAVRAPAPNPRDGEVAMPPARERAAAPVVPVAPLGRAARRARVARQAARLDRRQRAAAGPPGRRRSARRATTKLGIRPIPRGAGQPGTARRAASTGPSTHASTRIPGSTGRNTSLGPGESHRRRLVAGAERLPSRMLRPARRISRAARRRQGPQVLAPPPAPGLDPGVAGCHRRTSSP